MTRRPSQYLPAGVWKKVMPLGGPACPNAADKPPVSEFESPKLNMAGKSHCCLFSIVISSLELEDINVRNRNTIKLVNAIVV